MPSKVTNRPVTDVRLLLDTHVFIWFLEKSHRLKDHIDSMITESDEAWISVASIWEMEIKRASGKLSYDFDPLDAASQSGIEWLPVTVRHAMAISDVALDHGDPFDRMLMAQARVDGLSFVTADKRIVAAGADYVISAL